MLSEKRYLLKDVFSVEDINMTYKKISVEEYYTYISKCKKIKYKKLGDSFFKITKTKNDYKKNVIDKDKFEKNYKKKITHILSKDVYFFENDAVVCLYKKRYKGLKILQSSSPEAIKPFLPYIDEDITDRVRYGGVYLALYGNPLSDDKNIHKLMKKIKNSEKNDMKNFIKKDMSVDSAVRVKLYELYLKLVQDRFDLLDDEKNRANMLSIYRKRLKAILDILKENEDYFEEELVEKVKENLFYIYNKTAIDEELKSIKVKLKRYQKCLSEDEFVSFLKDEDAFISEEVERFCSFIQTREYSIILKQLELLIKESSIEVDDTKADTTIKEAHKRYMKKVYKRVKKAIKKYIDCEDVESFNKILKKVRALETLNDEFACLTKRKTFHKRKRVLSKLEENVEAFLIILKNIDLSKSKIKDASSLECLIKKFEKEKKDKLKELKESIKDLKKSKKLFIS